MDEIGVVLERLAEWVGRQRTLPRLFCACQRIRSHNRPSAYIGLAFQDGACCPWWEIGGERYAFSPDHASLLTTRYGSLSSPLGEGGRLWLASLDCSDVPAASRILGAYRFGTFRVRRPSLLRAAYRTLLGRHHHPRSPMPDFRRRAAYMELLALFLEEERNTGGRVEEERSPAVTRAIQRMAEGLGDPGLCLGELAATAHLSVHHFGRQFRKEMGTSPMAYLRQMRIAQAKRFLDTTALRIGEIAREVGYPDPLHFSRVFHRTAGLSPRDYRARDEADG